VRARRSAAKASKRGVPFHDRRETRRCHIGQEQEEEVNTVPPQLTAGRGASIGPSSIVDA